MSPWTEICSQKFLTTRIKKKGPTTHKHKSGIISPRSQTHSQFCMHALHTAHTLSISRAHQLLRVCFGLMPWLGRSEVAHRNELWVCDLWQSTIPDSSSIWPIRKWTVRGPFACIIARIVSWRQVEPQAWHLGVTSHQLLTHQMHTQLKQRKWCWIS